MHRIFSAVRHTVMQFSAKSSERNCLHDKGQCMSTKLNSCCFAACRGTVWKQN